MRYSEVLWSIMEEPGVVDVKQLRLLRYPPTIGGADTGTTRSATPIESFACEQDLTVSPTEVAELVDDADAMRIR
ncbi:hypothetical protein [Ilumatobacter sp.]|uniref:hypothetical protein n=1 Tax=Ilumatobacter sp. TaxID=1967498 RepID=UPI003B52A8FC